MMVEECYKEICISINWFSFISQQQIHVSSKENWNLWGDIRGDLNHLDITRLDTNIFNRGFSFHQNNIHTGSVSKNPTELRVYGIKGDNSHRNVLNICPSLAKHNICFHKFHLVHFLNPCKLKNWNFIFLPYVADCVLPGNQLQTVLA